MRPVARGVTSRHRNGAAAAAHRSSVPGPAEVTDIIPFDEFGRLDDALFGDDAFTGGAFDGSADVLSAPELDDLTDTDNMPVLQLAFPRGGYPDEYVYPPTRGAAGVPVRARGGKHRSQPTSAVKSRVMIAAMAAGAAAAAAHAATHPSGDTVARPAVLAASKTTLNDGTTTSSRGMQMITVKAAANVVVHNEELAKGVAFAQERAEREARLQRPLFVAPTQGAFTSNFGYRWGVLHAGIDIANAIGTPILAASDGVVIESGPSAGYGMLVKLRHSDGTVTLYGHINRSLVSVGERVMAGDQIAEMGNRGYSTGPHLHFEVLQNGTSRIDPTSWLAKRGINFA
ncbi:M23 family metallopeptidase [Mycolicibacter kumamotonensis]|uniref:M23 family metallopeptidase n=1 Tax=Mycolicibacter kumamotonensis TaxID=354243 RepID=A0A7K3LC84_9MYCO|nr:M23 family metallopeptidase [Mycolicibacter kumamotonensis]NDJ89912.1 M23 family metallopeptidase [Mycolicibacter kumamotonensis]